MGPSGAGLVLTQGGSDFAVASVNAGQPESVVVGLGLARDVDADRLRLLSWVNEQSRFGTMYTPCLWENGGAWDVVIRRQTNITIMVENPADLLTTIMDGFSELRWLRDRLIESIAPQPISVGLNEADGIALMAETIGG